MEFDAPPDPETSKTGAPPPPTQASNRGARLIRGLVLLILFVLSVAGGSLTGLLIAYQSDLPEISTLEDYRPSIISEIYSDEGNVIAEFAVERRVVIPFQDIPQHLKHALVATEDQHFYSHPGIDPSGIARAAILNLMEGRVGQGGSTITQQLSKLLFLTPDRTYERKIKEAILAFQIEKNYTKEEILTLYCNQVLLGHGVYGVEAGAQFYFGKSARELSLEEAALIAGLPGRPADFSPFANPDRALTRRNHVLNRMHEEGFILREVRDELQKRPIQLRRRTSEDAFASYFVEEVRQYLEQKYGSQRIYRGGLRVHTTLNERAQRVAEEAIDQALRDLDKRQGFRNIAFNVHDDTEGAIQDFAADDWGNPLEVGHMVSGVVTAVDDQQAIVRIDNYTATLTRESIEWTRATRPNAIMKVGDVTQFRIDAIDPPSETVQVTLEQVPIVEGAFLALETRTGQVKAMVGGFDFARSKFNRAVQARRQPGSAFKPFAYAAAIDAGFTATSLILDAPVQYKDPTTEEIYEPSNYDETYEGWITLRHALEASRNVPAVRLTEQIGPEKAAEMGRRLGLAGPLPPYLSLPLGSAEASLIEMVSAYSTFPNQGIRMTPYLVTKVTDRDGNLLEETRPKAAGAIRADTAYIVTHLLQGVVQRGTGVRASALGRPLGGKTGTTNDYTDAWFVGFDPTMAAGSWIGFDQKRSLGDRETGSRAALPPWIKFMEEAREEPPTEDFAVPSNIVFVPVDRHTGYPSHGSGRDVILEAFISGTEPAGYP